MQYHILPWPKSVKLHVVTVVRARSRPGVLVWNRKSYSLVWSHSCGACLHEHTGQFGTHDPWYLICRACSRPQSSKPKGISLHDSSDCSCHWMCQEEGSLLCPLLSSWLPWWSFSSFKLRAYFSICFLRMRKASFSFHAKDSKHSLKSLFAAHTRCPYSWMQHGTVREGVSMEENTENG